jgi:protein TonB
MNPSPKMNDNFFLPICFAAAAHGALLFGFAKTPRSPAPPAEKPRPTIFVIREAEEPVPEIVDTKSSNTALRIEPAAPQLPRSAEPLPVDITHRITMKPPAFQRVDASDIHRIVDFAGGPVGKGNKPPFGDVLSSIHLDNTPRTRFQATPTYPFEAKRTGTPGEVHVEFVVDERGRVIDPRVVYSSNRIFDEPTLRAVAKWQFEPGRRNGKTVKFRMTVPVMFNLNEGS